MQVKDVLCRDLNPFHTQEAFRALTPISFAPSTAFLFFNMGHENLNFVKTKISCFVCSPCSVSITTHFTVFCTLLADSSWTGASGHFFFPQTQMSNSKALLPVIHSIIWFESYDPDQTPSSAELYVCTALRYSTRRWKEMGMLDLEEEVPGVHVIR